MSQQEQVPPVDTAVGPGGADPVLDEGAAAQAAAPITASITTQGVRGEEREDFTKAESKRLRRRSLALLGSLAAPLKARLVLLGVVVWCPPRAPSPVRRSSRGASTTPCPG